MKKSTVWVLALLHLLLGIGIGFFASMVKNGFSVGNNSGNTTRNYNYYGLSAGGEAAEDPDALSTGQGGDCFT